MITRSKDMLVGYTGFVGSNLVRSHGFSKLANSKNIADMYGLGPDLLVYSGVPSAMFLANQDPEADLAIMANARENIRRIKPKKVVLVSSIAVYSDSRGCDECSIPSRGDLSAYGQNRLQLENWVKEDMQDTLILRLPALYGEGLKKNFIYDLIHVIPGLLTYEKYEELAASCDMVKDSYVDAENGFMKLSSDAKKSELKQWFAEQDFNALSFTDSRSKFQFYDLSRLWGDILSGLELQATVLNLATPPISAGEVFTYINGESWNNELNVEPFDYDMRSMFFLDEKGRPGYICSQEEELKGLKKFVEEHR